MSWPIVQLDQVAELDRRSVHPSETDPDTLYLGLEHIDGEGVIDSGATVTSAELKSNKFQFTDKHVLFGKLRPYLRKTARPSFSGVCSTDIIPILPRSELSRDYLFHLLRTPSMVDLATSRSSGANLPRLSPQQLASFQIPLPPLPEQKRIARILDAADALRARRRTALAELDALLQSTFLDMFGDPVTNPMGWEQKALVEVLHPDRPIAYGILKPGEYEENGVIMLRIQDIRGGEVTTDGLHRVTKGLSRQYKRTLLSGGEVVISLVGTIGLCALIPSHFAGANVHRNLAVVVPGDRLESRFLHQYMTSDRFQYLIKEATKGGNQSLLNLGDLKQLPILLPPLDHQRRFADIVESIDRQKTRMRVHLAELNAFFASLQSRAFNGEL